MFGIIFVLLQIATIHRKTHDRQFTSQISSKSISHIQKQENVELIQKLNKQQC